MPRKSLPAPRSTPLRPPKRGQSSTPAGRNGSTRKRARVLPEDDDLESLTADPTPAPVDVPAKGVAATMPDMDLEKELEQWQDFAVDHYEMVEQLPLELHRNYRLLRELDDGVILHSAKLQSTIREYIALRFDTKAKPTTPVVLPEEAPPLPSLTLGYEVAEPTGGDQGPNVPGADLPTPIPDGAGGQIVPPFDEQVNGTVAAESGHTENTIVNKVDTNEGADVDADGEADADGEVDVETKGAEHTVEARRPFPSVPPDGPRADVLPPQAIHHEPKAVTESQGSKARRLLPEIARLAREMVKNGEEKVAVAQGAYNSIDRHIRALDSALSTQEASILLGLRPNTEPSELVGDNQDLEFGVGSGGEEGDLAIGIGGGGPKRKGRASRAGRKKGGAAVEKETSKAGALDGVVIEADPNEPRYCYCNDVSYGQMIACENDDCPIEWFHLSCAGLTTPPTGKWLCEKCKPNIGLGKGGAGTVAPRGGPARSRGRASKGRSRR